MLFREIIPHLGHYANASDVKQYGRLLATIESWPPGILAAYARAVELLVEFGPDLEMPYSRAMKDGLLEEEQALARELLTARKRAGLTQEQVAAAMGTTKSAVSRLKANNGHAPSLRTLRSYARAVGCAVEIRFVAKSGR